MIRKNSVATRNFVDGRACAGRRLKKTRREPRSAAIRVRFSGRARLQVCCKILSLVLLPKFCCSHSCSSLPCKICVFCTLLWLLRDVRAPTSQRKRTKEKKATLASRYWRLLLFGASKFLNLRQNPFHKRNFWMVERCSTWFSPRGCALYRT